MQSIPTAVAIVPGGRLERLPYDIMLDIFKSLSPYDIVSVFSTCRTLHTSFSSDETVWRQLGGRLGFSDTTAFLNRSPHLVYTRLLHRYAPLIGLWAGDNPFFGSIMEFLVRPSTAIPGDSQIVGTLWHFPRGVEGSDAWDEPLYPRLMEFVRIGLSWDAEDPAADGVRIDWQVDIDPAHELPSIHLVTPAHQSLELCTSPLLSVPHPDFPGEAGAISWYDCAHALPPFPMEVHAYKNRAYDAHIPLPFLRCVDNESPGPAPTLPALMLRYLPEFDHRSPLRMPMFGYPDMRREVLPRYFPLKAAVREGVEPEHPEWTLASLEGVWLGSYGPHGTETIYFDYEPEGRKLWAWKITGDVNVPRGAHTWVVHENQNAAEDMRMRHGAVGFEIYHNVQRACAGVGTLSVRGFTNPESNPMTMIVMGKDEVHVKWEDFPPTHTAKYIRYKGHNTDLQSGQPPTW